MNKNDLRYVKTDKLIKNSFMNCVKNFGFEHTTVSMICGDAMINRNTFYIHFADKYALLDSLFSELENDFTSTFDTSYSYDLVNLDFSKGLRWYVENVNADREKIFLLLQCSRERMEELLQHVVVDMPISRIMPDYYERSARLEIQLNIKYMFSAMVSFTSLWLKNYDKISPDRAMELLGELCEKPTRMFLSQIFAE